MLERLLALVLTLLARFFPQSFDLGDEYDDFPIPEHPSEVEVLATDWDAFHGDLDGSQVANKGKLPDSVLHGLTSEGDQL